MTVLNKKLVSVLSLVICVFSLNTSSWAEYQEYSEVDKNKIPSQFLDRSVKTLPFGVAIWDNAEAIKALKDRDGKYVWIDTRPKSFLEIGTIKNAVHLVCDKKGKPVPEDKHGPELSRERLLNAISQVDANMDAVTVFFCQGPKCHRSYNAALRSVSDYNMDPSKIAWFRDGYPNLEKHITEDPKLNRRIKLYLQGDIVNE